MIRGSEPVPTLSAVTDVQTNPDVALASRPVMVLAHKTVDGHRVSLPTPPAEQRAKARLDRLPRLGSMTLCGKKDTA